MTINNATQAVLDLHQRLTDLDKGKVPDKIIPQGERDATLTSIAGSMRRRGMTAEEMLPSLLAINQGRCRSPLSDEQVEKIARSVERYAPAKDEAAARYNTLRRATILPTFPVRPLLVCFKPVFVLLAVGHDGTGQGFTAA
jgi:hypothetical protein